MEDSSGGYETRVDEMELAAMRAGGSLESLLAADEKAHGEIWEVFKYLTQLQTRLKEWVVLHHLLHRVLAAFSPFYNSLYMLKGTGEEAADWRVLLKDWHACQTSVDQLMDFEGDATDNHPDWSWQLALLQQEIEDGLRDEVCSIQGLMDLADDFRHACNAYLNVADREMRQTVEDMQRLYTQLVGGWS